MSNGLAAGVDCSTQATKVVVVDVDSGETVAEGRVAHDVFRHGAASETDPENWWTALAGALAQTGCAERIDSISIAAQQLGIVTLDRERRPLRRAILWDDTRSGRAAEQLREALGGPDRCAELVGTQPLAGFSVASWAWLRSAEPETAAKMACIRLPHDYLTERLTGNGVTDRGDASGTGWWSSRKEAYVTEVLEHPLVALEPSMLPHVLRPDEPAGTVREEAAKQLGLRPGIAVGCGTGDNMSAALALAVEPGTPVISLGTSGTAYLRSRRPPADRSGQVFAHASATGDHLPLACTLNATLAVDNVARMLGIEREAVADRARAVVMPFLSGERLPNYPDARGSIAGIDHTTTAGEILLAAYEGVAYSLVQSIEILDAHSSGVDPDAPIILVGGGARGAVWQRTISRLSGRELVVPRATELVAWGAAAQAAGVLAEAPAVEVAARWNVADGPRVSACPVDEAALERNERVREAAHALNSGALFPGD